MGRSTEFIAARAGGSWRAAMTKQGLGSLRSQGPGARGQGPGNGCALARARPPAPGPRPLTPAYGDASAASRPRAPGPRPLAPAYIELHARSGFSFLQGASIPEELAGA